MPLELEHSIDADNELSFSTKLDFVRYYNHLTLFLGISFESLRHAICPKPFRYLDRAIPSMPVLWS